MGGVWREGRGLGEGRSKEKRWTPPPPREQSWGSIGQIPYTYSGTEHPFSQKSKLTMKNRYFQLETNQRVCSENRVRLGTSLEVQWLRFHAANARDMGLIPGWRAKIPHAMWNGQTIFLKYENRIWLSDMSPFSIRSQGLGHCSIRLIRPGSIGSNMSKVLSPFLLLLCQETKAPPLLTLRKYQVLEWGVRTKDNQL